MLNKSARTWLLSYNSSLSSCERSVKRWSADRDLGEERVLKRGVVVKVSSADASAGSA